jgi:hypothetical protein
MRGGGRGGGGRGQRREGERGKQELNTAQQGKERTGRRPERWEALTRVLVRHEELQQLGALLELQQGRKAGQRGGRAWRDDVRSAWGSTDCAQKMCRG